VSKIKIKMWRYYMSSFKRINFDSKQSKEIGGGSCNGSDRCVIDNSDTCPGSDSCLIDICKKDYCTSRDVCIIDWS